jgi:hypothetical protein
MQNMSYQFVLNNQDFKNNLELLEAIADSAVQSLKNKSSLPHILKLADILNVRLEFIKNIFGYSLSQVERYSAKDEEKKEYAFEFAQDTWLFANKYIENVKAISDPEIKNPEYEELTLEIEKIEDDYDKKASIFCHKFNAFQAVENLNKAIEEIEERYNEASEEEYYSAEEEFSKEEERSLQEEQNFLKALKEKIKEVEDFSSKLNIDIKKSLNDILQKLEKIDKNFHNPHEFKSFKEEERAFSNLQDEFKSAELLFNRIKLIVEQNKNLEQPKRIKPPIVPERRKNSNLPRNLAYQKPQPNKVAEEFKAFNPLEKNEHFEMDEKEASNFPWNKKQPDLSFEESSDLQGVDNFDIVEDVNMHGLPYRFAPLGASSLRNATANITHVK